MKKFIGVLILATVFAEIINVQAQETINGDKIYTGDIRFNKGIYYGVNNATLPTAFNPLYTKFAVVYDQPSNPNLPTVSIGSSATAIHDQGIAVVKSGGGEPRMTFFRSAGTVYTPTNVVGGDVSGNMLFMNYFNGAYRRGANIFSQVVSPIPSSTFPSSTLTFSVRMPNNVTNELDQVLRLDENGKVRLMQIPTTSSTASNPLLTRNPTTGAIELQSQNTLSFANNGFIGINTTTPREHLSVNGKIRAHEIKLELTGFPDYVFDENYHSLSLHELEQFIKLNKHLPGIPSAKEVALEGVDMGELNKNLLQKIEELTLHLIEQNKKIEAQSVIINKILSK